MSNSVALLVMASNCPLVFGRAAELYRDAGFSVYVHVDAKVDLSSYKEAMGKNSDLCNFLDDRTHVYWAGFSMVDATVRLYRFAKLRSQHSHFVLVSDDTFPVVPLTRLSSDLAAQVDRIEARRLREGELFEERYKQYYYFDHRATTLRGRTIESASIDDAFFAALDRLRNVYLSGKFEGPIYYGSQWWCLRSSTLEKVIDDFYNVARIRESFEFSAVPDEFFFQTAVAHSEGSNIAPCPVLVDWARSPKPFVFASQQDILEKASAHHFFARKISDDPDLLDNLVKHCRS